MSRLHYKKEIEQLLKTENLEEIVASLAKIPEHIVINQLFSALCHPDGVVRWNSIKCLGRIVPQIASNNFEDARIIMRRCLWSLNDESGGIGWGIPEAMAEIMVNAQGLRDEYLHMLISYMREDGDDLFADGNYLELPMLQRGLLWGIGRICKEFPEEMRERGAFQDILAYLTSEDTSVVGYSIRALGNLGDIRARTSLQKFIGNTKSAQLYDGEEMREISLSEIAQECLALLDGADSPQIRNH